MIVFTLADNLNTLGVFQTVVGLGMSICVDRQKRTISVFSNEAATLVKRILHDNHIDWSCKPVEDYTGQSAFDGTGQTQ